MSKRCLKVCSTPLDAALIDGAALPEQADDLRYWVLGLGMIIASRVDAFPAGKNDGGHIIGRSDDPSGNAIGSVAGAKGKGALAGI
jgi:hypothetical protein